MATKPDPEGTERVVMVWPKELKDRVRGVAGHRGITEFVTKAVEEKLGEVPKKIHDILDARAEDEVRENKRVSQPVAPEPVSVKPAKKPASTRTNKPQADTSSPVDLPHDTQGRDDLFARLMAKTGGGVDFDQMKASLKPASEIPKPEPVVQTTCPTCGEELVDGECWTCG